ncbi:MAG TPA: ORF6N domain-containing protein [Thermoanaerobaculia bacterium]|nr:ORF6N domain-containing protein [Thermoanaerobaculia bacterium]
MRKKEVALARIESAILELRGQRVMLDADLAALYEVETRALVQAVKRNRGRFPADFLFQLGREELENLRSQIVMSSFWGGRRRPPYAFTEQGVAMLSSVLKSRRAVEVNVEIMRAFVRLRRILSSHEILARRIDELEARYDDRFKGVFDALRQLMAQPKRARKRIGFADR